MAAERRSGAESSRKVLGLLLAFDERRPTRTTAELAEAIGAPLSSTYRYLSVLRDSGLVEDADTPGSHRLTSRVIGLARAAREARGDMEHLLRPILQRTVAACGETALLVRRAGNAAVCVDRVESDRPVRLQFSPGQPMSLHLGSAARVLLAAMPPRERARYLDTLGTSARPPSENELALVAEAGWTQSFEEVDEGIWGVAAAVREEGRTVAAIGVAGPLFRIDQAERDRIILLVREAAAEAGAELDRLR